MNTRSIGPRPASSPEEIAEKQAKAKIRQAEYEKQRKINKDNMPAVRAILGNLGIKLMIGGCGCCDSPWLSFEYKGHMYLKDCENAAFNMFKEDKDD